MLDPAVLTGFVVAIVLVCAAPGPDNAYIAAVAAASGPRAGVLSAVGMALGMTVHVATASLGLGVLLASAPVALTAVRLGGAAYLAWLGVAALRPASGAAYSAWPSAQHPVPRATVRRALVVNLTNPKVILFFAAFLPQFVRAGHGPTSVQLLTLGLVFLAVGLGIDAGVGLAVGWLGAGIGRGGRAATALRVTSGLTFLTLAAFLLAEAVAA